MSNDQTLSENTLFFDSLAQAVFVRFDSRPTLVSVAWELFGAAFNSEYPALDIDLADVTLNTPNWITDNKGRRIDGYHRQPLLDVVTQSIHWQNPLGGSRRVFADGQGRTQPFRRYAPDRRVPASIATSHRPATAKAIGRLLEPDTVVRWHSRSLAR